MNKTSFEEEHNKDKSNKEYTEQNLKDFLDYELLSASKSYIDAFGTQKYIEKIQTLLIKLGER